MFLFLPEEIVTMVDTVFIYKAWESRDLQRISEECELAAIKAREGGGVITLDIYRLGDSVHPYYSHNQIRDFFRSLIPTEIDIEWNEG